MRYILEAHSGNDSSIGAGLYFLGNELEVTSTLRMLLAGTLGALAVRAPGVSQELADFAIEKLSRDVLPSRIVVPRYLVTDVVEVLGGNTEGYLNARGDQLVASAVAGHLTMGPLLQEKKELREFMGSEPPQWLTCDGLYATCSDDGNITPEVNILEPDLKPLFD